MNPSIISRKAPADYHYKHPNTKLENHIYSHSHSHSTDTSLIFILFSGIYLFFRMISHKNKRI